MLSSFRSTTGRNQPGNSEFVFGPSCWLRSLIKPPPGRAIAYIDWSGQELGIAPYLSGDPNMIADYESGDPYLGFGKRAGLMSADATKQSHRHDRERLKVSMGLGAMYGAGPRTVAETTDQPVAVACDLLRLHRVTYPVSGGRRSRHAAGMAHDHVRLDGACGQQGQPAIAKKFPDAGQRCRNAPYRVLPGNGAWHRRLLPRSRRHLDRRAR